MKNLTILLLAAVMILSSCRKRQEEIAQPCYTCGNGGNSGNGGNGLPAPTSLYVMYVTHTVDPSTEFRIDKNCDGIISTQEEQNKYYDVTVTDGQGSFYTMYGSLTILNNVNGLLQFPPGSNPDPSQLKPVLRVTIEKVTIPCGTYWEVKTAEFFGYYSIWAGKAVQGNNPKTTQANFKNLEKTNEYKSIFFKYNLDGSVQAEVKN